MYPLKIIDGIFLDVLPEKDDLGLQVYKLRYDHTDDVYHDYVIPKGFRTNGASTPWILRWWFGPTGEMFRASVVHDYLYTSHVVSRKKSDQIFKRILRDDGVSWIKANLAYMGLRVGGGPAWDSPVHPKQIPVRV